MKKLILMLLLATATTATFSQLFIGMNKKTLVSTIKSYGGTFVQRNEGKDGCYNLTFKSANGLGIYGFTGDDLCVMTIENQPYNEDMYENICKKMDEKFDRVDGIGLGNDIVWSIPMENEDDNVYYWTHVDKKNGFLITTTVKQSDYEKYSN